MAALASAEIRACIHPRQRSRFILALIFAILLFPLMLAIAALGTVSLILPLILFTIWVSGEVFFANFLGNAICVSELNYPRILNLAQEIKTTLDVEKKFDIYIFEQGAFNASMVKLFFRRAIFLNSEILEVGVSDDEVRWIVGRFVGYWWAQKNAGVAGWLIRRARSFGIFNFFLLPFDRAMVYTGDRLGLAAIGGDISTGISAMQKLLVGRQLGYSVNPIGIVEQSGRVKGSAFAILARLWSGFPHMITRYVDLIVFAEHRFPDQFHLFTAANPGLPDNMKRLSGEVSSPGAAMRAVGIMFLSALLPLLIVAGIIAAVAIPAYMESRNGALDFMKPSGAPDLDKLLSPDQGSPPPDQNAPPDQTNPPDQANPQDQNGQPATQDGDGKIVTIRNQDGSVYKGPAVDGVPEGEGTETDADGNVFAGTFHNGEYVSGTYTWTTGDRYEGDFSGGQPSGQGVLQYKDGTSYEGSFADGQPEGHGTFTYPDGRIYKGEVHAGLAEGKGTLTDADGKVLTRGKWKEGQPVGK